MGMFDTIIVHDKCPYCGLFVGLDCQTKDLEKALFTYKALHKGYLEGEDDDSFYVQDRELRKKLSTCRSFPEDKEHSVWSNQLERRRAMAKLSKNYESLEYVNVFCECPSHKCKTRAELAAGKDWSGLSMNFEAKLPVINGYIINELFDVNLRDKGVDVDWFGYPKIQTLWKRDAKNQALIVEGDYSKEEFANIQLWRLTEKIHGQNFRILFKNNELRYGGRTDSADLHPLVLSDIKSLVTLDKCAEVFSEANTVMLFGEAVGPKIHDVGRKYSSPSHDFILFDVVVDGWWLEQPNVEDIAKQLGLKSAPYLGLMTKEEIQLLVRSKPDSKISQEELRSEGIVTRSHPLMLFRDKTPIMFKLKASDYDKLEKHIAKPDNKQKVRYVEYDGGVLEEKEFKISDKAWLELSELKRRLDLPKEAKNMRAMAKLSREEEDEINKRAKEWIKNNPGKKWKW
jgi:hypothetical protein